MKLNIYLAVSLSFLIFISTAVAGAAKESIEQQHIIDRLMLRTLPCNPEN